MLFVGEEHGVLGSRRVDGPAAEAGGERAGVNESIEDIFPKRDAPSPFVSIL